VLFPEPPFREAKTMTFIFLAETRPGLTMRSGDSSKR
jgi:hypothetical protein